MRVSVRRAVSDKFDLRHGGPQGSCLGLLLFTVYTGALFNVVEKHLLVVYRYADDSHWDISFDPKAHSAQADGVASIEHFYWTGFCWVNVMRRWKFLLQGWYLHMKDWIIFKNQQ